MAVFVDCLGILTLLLVLYVLASTAQALRIFKGLRSWNPHLFGEKKMFKAAFFFTTLRIKWVCLKIGYIPNAIAI
jgi:hypothetical protein